MYWGCNTIVLHFQIVRLSILSVLTLYLKYLQTRNDTIHPEILQTVRGIRWEQICLGVGNLNARRIHRQQLTIIYCLMFSLHTVAGERERERESKREKERERVSEREKERESVSEREKERERVSEREREKREREKREGEKRERVSEREREKRERVSVKEREKR